MHEGAAFVWEKTTEAAQARLDRTLDILRTEGLQAEGALGDYRPLRALAEAVKTFDRTGSSSAPCPRTARRGSATTWSTGRGRRTTCR